MDIDIDKKEVIRMSDKDEEYTEDTCIRCKNCGVYHNIDINDEEIHVFRELCDMIGETSEDMAFHNEEKLTESEILDIFKTSELMDYINKLTESVFKSVIEYKKRDKVNKDVKE